jgi:hypothetical protein
LSSEALAQEDSPQSSIQHPASRIQNPESSPQSSVGSSSEALAQEGSPQSSVGNSSDAKATEVSQQSAVGSFQPTNVTSDPGSSIQDQASNQQSAIELSSEVLAQVDIQQSNIPDRESRIKDQATINLYEALPIYNTLPQRGFAPMMHQENQTIALKQEYLSPPVQKSGYNPLSWAVSAYLAPQQPSVLLESDDSEGDALLTYIESGLQQPSVFNGGIRVEARGRNFLIESGLSFLKISQKAKYQTQDISYKLRTTWEYRDSSYTKIDTIDSYYQIVGSDTSWFYVTQTATVNLHDSTPTTHIDTLREDLAHKFSNRYKYLEIPLIVGYSFNKGRFTTSVKAGVINSFLWKAYGKSISGNSKNDIYTFTHDDFPAIRFDGYLGLETRYFIGSRYFVFGEAFYRQSFGPFINRNNISYHFNSYGLKLGAGIYL